MKDLTDRQYLTLSLCEERYAIAIGSVREVLEYSRPTRIPSAAAYLKGIISLRGRSIPILDLRLRFGLADRPKPEDSAIIVVEMPGGETVVGITADSVHEVLEIPPDDLEPPPLFGIGPAAAFVSGIGRDEAGFILVLDIDLILDEGGLGPEPALAVGA